ncbi:hypothetical protein B484DRAFT_127815 [Ochromonadaceae sp. CCMP2298]|nr:hypothetical protein B484DRAFT_127815 [Ochromonadaceae sp. CCMP2298]
MATKKGAAPPDPEQVAEVLSNSMLKDIVNNLEETKLKLLLTISELKDKLAQQKDDQSDIYYYLNKKCDESFEVIASLEEQILNEQTDREIAEKLYENKIDEQKTSAAAAEVKSQSKVSDLETRLEMLSSFNEEKEESERNLQDLMVKLEEERAAFKTNAESIENRFLVERDKLRKAFEQKYAQTKRELESSVEVKMTSKTKKTQIMNLVMKKELDMQSKHAEKLLEINQQVIQRDRGLKLELQLSTSLHSDTTMKLAISQRTVKQLTDRVAALEAAESEVREAHSEALHMRASEVATLQGQISGQGKKARLEDEKRDDLWRFLARSYQLLRGKRATAGERHFDPREAAAGVEQGDRLLVNLLREAGRKYPDLLAAWGQGGGGSAYSTLDGSGSVASMRSVPSLGLGAARGVAGAVGLHAHAHTSHALGIGGRVFEEEGAWDIGSVLSGGMSHVTSSSRSVAVQTDGPAIAARAAHAAAMGQGMSLSVAEEGSVGSVGMGSMGRGEGSVGFHSVQSGQWREGGQSYAMGQGGLGTSLASSQDDAYSAKTASHLMMPPRRSKSGKSMSRVRRQGRETRRSERSEPPASDFSDLAMLGQGRLGGGGGGADFSTVRRSPQLGAIRQAPLSPVTLGSVGSLSSSGRYQQPFSPSMGGMAVAGQGFVAPLVLPKL